MDNDQHNNPEFNSDSFIELPESIKKHVKGIKEFDNNYLCNKEQDKIFCTFRPDQVVIVLIALSRFAEQGRTKVRVDGSEDVYFYTYDDFASKTADDIWQGWFYDLTKGLDYNINEPALTILPRIVTGLLALYTEDKFAYYSLVNKNWRLSPLLKMSSDASYSPAEIDIILSALMNLERKGYPQPKELREAIEKVVNKYRSQDTLYYNDIAFVNPLESGISKIILLQFEQIHNWPCHATLYWNEKTYELHYSKLAQQLQSHPHDFNNYPPRTEVFSQYSAKDYQSIKKLVKGLGIEKISFSHSYPELEDSEYEKLTKIDDPAEEEHIYAQAGWKILSRGSLFS